MKWFEVAQSLIGTREIVGSKHNRTILGWAKRLGARILGITVTDDETAWCGTFAAHCMVEAGITPPKIAVRASSWAEWGLNLRADRLARGAVLVFRREGGGHVAFYAGEDKDCYHVLGGNQGNAVSVARIEKARCVARRWPEGVPVIGAPVWMSAKGVMSKNEV